MKDFDYPLPKELIAQRPLAQRDASRLLVVKRKNRTLEDRRFSDILGYIPAGDLLVLNDTKVFPARLFAKKKGTGGKLDVLLLGAAVGATHASPLHGNIWRCLVQPSFKEGREIILHDGTEALFLKRDSDGTPLVDFKTDEDVRRLAARIGAVPLPPYIKRPADEEDRETYQTVFAEKEGAVAAPTAGLHFTKELLAALARKGVEILTVTLHVGYGTFKPVEDIENHRMHVERFELSEEAACRINKARSQERGIWAVGTTTLRVLETCARRVGTRHAAPLVTPGRGETNLYIRPPFTFEVTDHLVTNFHLPRTTLLLLVSAFMGESLRKKAYEHALKESYRFYSYGDAMMII